MIIIVSTLEDIHACAIQWSLRSSGIPCEILDVFNLPSSKEMHIKKIADRLELGWRTEDETRRIDVKDLRTVWLRRINTKYFDYTRINNEDIEAAKKELSAFVLGIYITLSSLEEVVAINRYQASCTAGSKLYQLMVAQSVGLNIPSTVMGNDYEEVSRLQAFCEDEVIFKSFHQHQWNENGIHLQMASRIDLNKISATSIKLCPGIYQEQIEKTKEIRVMVMDDELHAVRIIPRSDTSKDLDGRAMLFAHADAEHYSIPSDVKHKILAFMRKMGLRFGCLDMLVSNHNDYVFLEVNEQGQFLWVEEMNKEIRLLSSFSSYLARISGYSSRSFPSFLDFISSDCYKQRDELRKQRLSIGHEILKLHGMSTL